MESCDADEVDVSPDDLHVSEVQKTVVIANSNINSKITGSSMERSGRRNKCKSAVVLLGLVKSRARRANSGNFDASDRVLNYASGLRDKKVAKLEASADLPSKCNLNTRKSWCQTDSSSIGTDAVARGDWLKPFECGWRREVVHRGTSKSSSSSLSKPNADVYYFAPEQVKLRSMPEVIEYLKRVKSLLNSECFTFIKQSIYQEPHEVVRLAGVAKGRQYTSDLPVSTNSLSLSSRKKNSQSSVELGDSAIATGSKTSCSLSALRNILKSRITQQKSKHNLSRQACRMVDKTSTQVNHGSRKTVQVEFGNVSLCEMASDVNLADKALPHSTAMSPQLSEQNTCNLVPGALAKSLSVELQVIKDDRQPKKRSISVGSKKKVVKLGSTPNTSKPIAAVASDYKPSAKKSGSSACIATNFGSSSTSCRPADGHGVSTTCPKSAPAKVNVVKIYGSRAEIASEFGLLDDISSPDNFAIKNNLLISSVATCSSLPSLPASNEADVLSGPCRIASSANASWSCISVSQKPSTSTIRTQIQDSGVDIDVSQNSSFKISVSSANTSSVDCDRDMTRNNGIFGAIINQSGQKSSGTSFEFRQCGLDCAGRFGVPPSLHCDMCMSAFHPECVGFSHFAHKTGFNCKACHQLQRELNDTKYCLNQDLGLKMWDNVSFLNSKMWSEQNTIRKPTTSLSVTSLTSERKLSVFPEDNEQHLIIESKQQIISMHNKLHLTPESNRRVILVDVEHDLIPGSNQPLIASDVVVEKETDFISGADVNPSNKPHDEMSVAITCPGSILQRCENGLLSFRVMENCEHLVSTDDTNETSQVLILPAVVQYMFNPSLPVEVILENEHVLLPPCCCQFSEAELLISLPAKTLSANYLTGSSKPISCKVYPGREGCNQILEMN